MSHSKMFLSVTTGILALAAVALAKNYAHTRTAYYVTANLKYCQSVVTPCTKNGMTDCYYTTGIPAQYHFLFTQGPVGLWTPSSCKGSTIKIRVIE